LEGSIARPEYDKRNCSLKVDITKLKRLAGVLKNQLGAMPDRRRFAEAAKRIYNMLIDKLYSLKYEDKSFVIHQLVSHITYASGKATMTVLLPSCQLQEQSRVDGDL
jgi:hypothetical protein